MNSELCEPFETNTGVRQGCVLSPALFKLFVNDLPSCFNDSCEPVTLFTEKINCLLFADDLVLISESEDGLQNALNLLDDYCSKWHLFVNLTKTKVVIFNKTGRKVHHNLNFRKQLLDSSNFYTYLGLEMTASGSFTQSITKLCEKAQKVIFKIQRSFGYDLPVKVGLKLFDCLIKPILLYGCQIWGSFLFKSEMFSGIETDIFDKLSFETVHLKVLKILLGVHKNTTNIAVRGELGRYPLFIDVCKHMVKYWLKLTESTENTLLYDAYKLNMSFVLQDKDCWIKPIKSILCATNNIYYVY